MKKKLKRLSFKKETIVNLTDSHMGNVYGGNTTTANCTDFCPGVTVRCGGMTDTTCSQLSNCVTDPGITTCPSIPK